MAAFSSTSFHHHHPFLLDSVFLPTSLSTTDSKNIMPMSSPPFLHQSPDFSFNQQNPIQDLGDNDASAVNKNSMDNNSSSIVSDHKLGSNKKRKCRAASSANSAQSKDKREVRGKKKKKMRDEEEEKNNSKEENKAEEAGYIHVRARRGQATDSHSLAERVRRERISERMKLLQALVPGCDKLHVVLCEKQVTGKALMLDEIINYVQSLQNQVEFLSMKLASVKPMSYDFGVDLESFMADQDLSEFPLPPMASMQECSPTTDNNYNNFLDNNPANLFLFQQAQLPNDLSQPQGSRQALWEVDEHRQKIINQPGFNNSLFSFN